MSIIAAVTLCTTSTKINSEKIPAWVREVLKKYHPYLKSCGQLMAAKEGRIIFLRDLSPERLPMLQQIVLHIGSISSFTFFKLKKLEAKGVERIVEKFAEKK